MLLNSQIIGIFNPLVNISCTLPNPVSIAAAKFTFNQAGTMPANFHVASCNLVLSVNSSSSSLLEALVVWHVNALAQLLQRLLEARGVPRDAVERGVIGKETSQCESRWRNKDLPMSVLVHGEGFERKGKLSY